MTLQRDDLEPVVTALNVDGGQTRDTSALGGLQREEQRPIRVALDAHGKPQLKGRQGAYRRRQAELPRACIHGAGQAIWEFAKYGDIPFAVLTAIPTKHQRRVCPAHDWHFVGVGDFEHWRDDEWPLKSRDIGTATGKAPRAGDEQSFAVWIKDVGGFGGVETVASGKGDRIAGANQA